MVFCSSLVQNIFLGTKKVPPKALQNYLLSKMWKFDKNADPSKKNCLDDVHELELVFQGTLSTSRETSAGEGNTADDSTNRKVQKSISLTGKSDGRIFMHRGGE